MRCALLFFLLKYVFSSVETASSDPKKGVMESPNQEISYRPGGSNEKVGVKGTQVESDGLSLRRHTDEGGLVVFLAPNPYEEWSFSYTFTNAKLRFPHIGGVYLWYTSEIQDQGSYRGGHDLFEGIMAGLEFRGSQPEIVMAINDGKTSLVGSEEMTLYRDTVNPERLKGVKDITVKVISTHKNFKVELYDGDRLLYDSFRYYRKGTLAGIGSGKYFNITSFYDKAPSDSVYKLKEAQLFERTETSDYEVHSIHAPSVDKTPRSPDGIMHEDEEVRHLISKIEYLNEYLHLVVGEPHNSSFDKVVHILSEQLKAFTKKFEDTITPIRSVGGSETKLMNLNEKMNGIDIKLQKIQKAFADLDHVVGSLKNDYSRSSNFLVYIILGVGAVGLGLMAMKEYNALKFRQKAL
ncbi:uncharacterized protein Eint_071570 [Encephalitozoon intestinalis ATCC 50506]|uniref:Threonyl-tRNA synthetase n=1 Tax=Encephalitozoon intestinalis (strain ATCC 50506) TaxID=876142 RepID=E0S881_ENCIT|nr:uncharacterized protein Eint_071570 [Encephalitozoon intestinalis ATCC 50506]ADM11916.2 hypothetical protein Eint_071570 [Encephalitozoon intestinalis ATCC 50506]